MTTHQEEVIELARKAGFVTGTRDFADGLGGIKYVTTVATGTCLVELENFYKLAVAKDREACAKVCDTASMKYREVDAFECAAAIRARGEA